MTGMFYIIFINISIITPSRGHNLPLHRIGNYPKIKKEKIILDNDETRSYGNLLKGSSIIATDYGSAVLDAIYLDKKILNITWPNDKIIKKILKREECNDYLAKNHLVKINFTKNLNPKFKKK